jgi:hypothetical protein
VNLFSLTERAIIIGAAIRIMTVIDERTLGLILEIDLCVSPAIIKKTGDRTSKEVLNKYPSPNEAPRTICRLYRRGSLRILRTSATHKQITPKTSKSGVFKDIRIRHNEVARNSAYPKERKRGDGIGLLPFKRSGSMSLSR